MTKLLIQISLFIIRKTDEKRREEKNFYFHIIYDKIY